jgi:hypothetical protein
VHPTEAGTNIHADRPASGEILENFVRVGAIEFRSDLLYASIEIVRRTFWNVIQRVAE